VLDGRVVASCCKRHIYIVCWMVEWSRLVARGIYCVLEFVCCKRHILFVGVRKSSHNAHPRQDIASFESQIAPLFLVACAMFPFVVQISEVVSERELKLRQVRKRALDCA